MKVHRWEDIRRQKLSDKQLEENACWVEREIIELNLRALLQTEGDPPATQDDQMSRGGIRIPGGRAHMAGRKIFDEQDARRSLAGPSTTSTITVTSSASPSRR